MFRQDFTCPALLKDLDHLNRYGAITLNAGFPNPFPFNNQGHWPHPRSLATTNGVSFDVLSYRYLDVSLPCVRLLSPILFRDRYLHVTT